MEFKRYNTFTMLTSHLDDWDRILNQCASHVPFLTNQYLQSWWQSRGGGEWPADSELVLIAAFEEAHLIGVAPLFHSKNLEGKRALMFVGAIEVSDFLDFVVTPQDLPGFIRGLIDFLLDSDDIPPWDVLDLYNILEESPTLKALKAEAERREWSHEQIYLQPAPYIPLPGDFSEYMAGIDKKQRHEIRRKMRNVEQSLAEADFYFVEDEAQLHDETQAFIDIMAQDPNKSEFLTEAMVEHIHHTAQTAFENGWLQLAFFTLDGKKAAANMAFNFNHRLWLYNSGWEWEFRDFSPGWVLLTYLLEWSNANGINEFDFMRGDENYKYKFGGIDRHIYRVVIKRG